MFPFAEYDPTKAPTDDERRIKIRNLGLEVGKYVESKYLTTELVFLLFLKSEGYDMPETPWIHALMAEYKSRAAQVLAATTIEELHAIPLTYAEALDSLFPNRTILDAIE